MVRSKKDDDLAFRFKRATHHDPKCYTFCVSRDRIPDNPDWPGQPFLSNLTRREVEALADLIDDTLGRSRR